VAIHFSFEFFLSKLITHSFICAAAVSIYVLVIILVFLLQLANNTSGNSIHFIFYLSSTQTLFTSRSEVLLCAFFAGCSCCGRTTEQAQAARVEGRAGVFRMEVV
jgi:ABC-type transport system involved in multi-copper enzyme maturation permease subunit